MQETSDRPVRTFIAIDIGPEVRRRLADVQATLQRAAPAARVRWVPPANIHLTLAFLGDLFPAMLGPLAAAVGPALSDVQEFESQAERLGFFGPPRSPRVLWAGLRDDGGRLAAVYAAASSALRALRIAIEDRPFKPHLTLGRVRGGRGARALVDAVRSRAALRFGAVRAGSVQIIKSTLRPEGACYTVLETLPLCASAQTAGYDKEVSL